MSVRPSRGRCRLRHQGRPGPDTSHEQADRPIRTRFPLLPDRARIRLRRIDSLLVAGSSCGRRLPSGRPAAQAPSDAVRAGRRPRSGAQVGRPGPNELRDFRTAGREAGKRAGRRRTNGPRSGAAGAGRRSRGRRGGRKRGRPAVVASNGRPCLIEALKRSRDHPCDGRYAETAGRTRFRAAIHGRPASNPSYPSRPPTMRGRGPLCALPEIGIESAVSLHPKSEMVFECAGRPFLGSRLPFGRAGHSQDCLDQLFGHGISFRVRVSEQHTQQEAQRMSLRRTAFLSPAPSSYPMRRIRSSFKSRTFSCNLAIVSRPYPRLMPFRAARFARHTAHRE